MRGFRKTIPEFGKLVRATLDERGLSLRGAMIKTNVHASTIGDMARGIIAGPEVIRDFADGLQIDPLPLLIAAGHESPREVLEVLQVGLRAAEDISDEGKKQIMDFAVRIREEYPAKKEGNGDA